MLTPKWIIHTAITVFITMIFIYFIKKISTKYEIPVVSKVAAGV